MNFTATLTDRKWMKAAKAYRMYFELDSLETAVAMTGKIEKSVQMLIKHSRYPQIQAVLDPCHIVDVPHKAKKFTLVCETCSEYQNFIGELLTPVIGDLFYITTDELTTEPTLPQQQLGDINEKSLKGLHATFFNNKQFWNYISSCTQTIIHSPEDCKAGFKQYMGITSCKELQQDDFDATIRGFNSWLNRGASA